MKLEASQFTKEYFRNLSWDSEPLLWRTVTREEATILGRPDQVASKTDLQLPSIWLYGNCGSPTSDPQGHTLYLLGHWKMTDAAVQWTDSTTVTLLLWHGWDNGDGGTNWTICRSDALLSVNAGAANSNLVMAGASSNVARIAGLPAGRYRITTLNWEVPVGVTLEIWAQRNR